MATRVPTSAATESETNKPQTEESMSIVNRVGMYVYDTYDTLVLTMSNSLAWRCPTGTVLLPFYQQHVGESAHLEIRVGSGYYPAASVAALSKTKVVTLLDDNQKTLAMARQRIARAGYKGEIDLVEHNLTDPLPESMSGKYDSVALFDVFESLPGSLPKKATDVFALIAPVLIPDAVVYGATILGSGGSPSWLGTRLMGMYNKKGTFHNVADTKDELTLALHLTFDEWDVRVVGAVALFEARKPKSMHATT